MDLHNFPSSLDRRRLAAWAGRLLLLSAVVFWWGAVVAPQVFSLALPSVLDQRAIPPALNPENEGIIANSMTVASYAALALLALVNVARKQQTIPAVVGWGVLAAVAGFLALDDGGSIYRLVNVRVVIGELWPVFATVAAAGCAAFVFARRSINRRAVRQLLVLGFAAWALAVFYDEFSRPVMTPGWRGDVASVVEETLEFSGALILGLAATVNLAKRPGVTVSLCKPALGATLVVVVLGGAIALDAVRLYRELLLDTRGRTVIDMHIYDNSVEEHSLVQELGTLPAPLGRIRLRVTNYDPQGRPGVLLWRIIEAGESGDRYDRGGSGRILREGRIDVAARDEPRWENIDFPPLVEAADRPLAVQLVAEVERGAYLRIGGTKTDSFDHLNFRVNNLATWPDQKLELVAYGPNDLTRSKLEAIGRHFVWSWPVLLVAAFVGLTMIIAIPVLLIRAVWETGTIG